jgi:hypothetical protein
MGTLNRPVVFVLLGPLLGLCVAVLAEVMAGGRVCLSCDLEGPVLIVFFSFWVSLLTCPIDAALSRFAPTIVRVPLTAICGAAIAAGVMMLLVGKIYIPLVHIQPAMTIAAICMGLCAFLSSGRKRSTAQ